MTNKTRHEVLTVQRVVRRDGECMVTLRWGAKILTPPQKYPFSDGHLVHKDDIVEAILSGDGHQLKSIDWRTRSRRRFPEEHLS